MIPGTREIRINKDHAKKRCIQLSKKNTEINLKWGTWV